METLPTRSRAGERLFRDAIGTLLCTICVPNVHQRAFFEGVGRDASLYFSASCVTAGRSKSGEGGIRTLGDVAATPVFETDEHASTTTRRTVAKAIVEPREARGNAASDAFGPSSQHQPNRDRN